jgi:hypothetical protein
MKKIYFFVISLTLGLALQAQTLPCANLETWVNSTESGANYLIPQGWITVDQVQNAFTPGYTGISTLRSTSSHAGQYAALLQTTVQGTDTVSGALISHPSVSSFFSVAFGGPGCIGFPYATRSANLTGFYKYTKVGNDSVHVSIVMTKWNSGLQKRDTIAFVDEKTMGTAAASYTSFSIPITYSLNLFPDTALIVFALNGPNSTTSHVGTQFFLDDLAFSGTVPVGIKENPSENNLLHFFPNPFSQQATIRIDPSVGSNPVSFQIFDALGKEVKTIEQINDNEFTLEKGDLHSGIYFYRLVNEKGVLTSGRFVIE